MNIRRFFSREYQPETVDLVAAERIARAVAEVDIAAKIIHEQANALESLSHELAEALANND